MKSKKAGAASTGIKTSRRDGARRIATRVVIMCGDCGHESEQWLTQELGWVGSEREAASFANFKRCAKDA